MMQDQLSVKILLFLAASLLLTKSFAVEADMVCYVEGPNGKLSIISVAKGAPKLTGTFEDVSEGQDALVTTFQSDKSELEKLAALCHFAIEAQYGADSHYKMRGIAAVVPSNQMLVPITFKPFGEELNLETFVDQTPSSLSALSRAKTMQLVAGLPKNNTTIAKQDNQGNAEFFANSAQKFDHVYISVMAVNSKYSGKIALSKIFPQAIKHKNLNLAKGLLASEILHYNVADSKYSRKSSLLAANFVISYNSAFERLINMLTEHGVYLKSLGAPLHSELTYAFHFTGKPGHIYIDINSTADYGGYATYAANIHTPFSISYDITLRLDPTTDPAKEFDPTSLHIAVVDKFFGYLDLKPEDKLLANYILQSWLLDQREVTKNNSDLWEVGQSTFID